MTDKNTNATSKLDELKARVHKHDVIINRLGDKKTITDKDWYNILNSDEAKKEPNLSYTVATAVVSMCAAAIGEKLTKQYGTDNESHFGFCYRPIESISKIKEMFSIIDNLTFFTATHGDCEKIDLSTLGKALVGNGVDMVIETETIERLNWMFNQVMFLCGDILRDNNWNSYPKFYSVSAEKNGLVLGHWIVLSDYVEKCFGDDGNDGDITITDDGVTITFSKTAPTIGEIWREDDDFCLVSFYDAIKNLITDLYYEES